MAIKIMDADAVTDSPNTVCCCRTDLQATLGAAGLGQEGDAVLRGKVLHQLPQREVLLLRLRPPAAFSSNK